MRMRTSSVSNPLRRKSWTATLSICSPLLISAPLPPPPPSALPPSSSSSSSSIYFFVLLILTLTSSPLISRGPPPHFSSAFLFSHPLSFRFEVSSALLHIVPDAKKKRKTSLSSCSEGEDTQPHHDPTRATDPSKVRVVSVTYASFSSSHSLSVYFCCEWRNDKK